MTIKYVENFIRFQTGLAMAIYLKNSSFLKMISNEVRNFILSQRMEGVRFTDIVEKSKHFCSKSTVVRVLNSASGRKGKKKKPGPKSKVDGNMAKRIIRRLTTTVKRWSIRSIAKRERTSDMTFGRVLKKKGIKVFKKVKRHLITTLHAERRRICCRHFRKTYKQNDLPEFVWVDECQ